MPNNQNQKVKKEQYTTDGKFAGRSNILRTGPAEKNKAVQKRVSNGTSSDPQTGTRFVGKQGPVRTGTANTFSSAFRKAGHGK